MKRLLLPLFLCLSLMGCALLGLGQSSTSPSQTADQQVATDIVKGLDVAWNAAVPVCLDAEKAGVLPAGSCAKALLPANDALQLAASAVDTWSQASQDSMPCLVAQIVTDMRAVETLLQDAKVTIPPVIIDAQNAAGALAGTCVVTPDAGAGG
jgi:hypothetical protein